MERAARVRAAVLGECRTVARARAVRRRVLATAGALAAAAAVLMAVRVWLPSAVRPPIGARLALVETAQGTGLQLRDTTGALSAPYMQTGAAIREGDRIATDGASRVSVRLTGGASLRFDHATAVRLVSARRIELSAGAVYVDSGPASPGLEVRTPLASVRDIGTQFEVRVGAGSLRVRVRSGLVEVQRGRDVSSARPGTELTVASGGVTSRDILAHGPDWEWAARLAPAFAIEGRSLRAFLERWCHEEGWALAYAHPALAREASGIDPARVDGRAPAGRSADRRAHDNRAHASLRGRTTGVGAERSPLSADTSTQTRPAQRRPAQRRPAQRRPAQTRPPMIRRRQRTRVRRFALAWVVFCIGASAAFAQSTSGTLVGRRLEEALRIVQAHGLRLVFSSQLVTPEMRVRVEPRASSPRAQLDELLAPHGLAAERGPGGVIQIVRRQAAPARARAVTASPSEAGPPAGAGAGARDGLHREQVTVTANRLGPGGGHVGAARILGAREMEAFGSHLGDDPLRTVQALPGVAAADDFRSEDSVRGQRPPSRPRHRRWRGCAVAATCRARTRGHRHDHRCFAAT